MREVLKSSVGKTLHRLKEEDRIAAAWTVASGRALAERSTVVGFAGGFVQVEVADTAWLQQLMTITSQLKTEVARIAEVEVAGIHFEVKGFDSLDEGRGNEQASRRNSGGCAPGRRVS